MIHQGLNIDVVALERDIDAWLSEDVGHGDITTALTVDQERLGEASIIFKEGGVLAGIWVAEAVFRRVDPDLTFEGLAHDGHRIVPGTVVATIEGRLASILTAERLALNLLQRMSGVATMTAAFVSEVSETAADILDTRKTTPGLRRLEKYAVRVGGGRNHRFGLFDGILIKDNHIEAAGGVRQAVQAALSGAPHTLVVEVEVGNLEELDVAIESGADAVLLDNMGVADMREAVRRVGGKVLIEASGNMTLQRVREVAQAGVDLISVGALTHSAPALDISLDIRPS